MRFKNTFIYLLLFSAITAASAQDSASVRKPEMAKLKPYGEIITSKALTKNGLFSVHKIDEKYFFEIPDSLLKREFLFTSRLVKVPSASPLFAGTIINHIIVTFEKAPNDKFFVRVVTNVAQCDSTDALYKAVKNANTDPIVMLLDVKARGKANNSSVVEVTDFILKDNLLTGFSAEAKKAAAIGAQAPDRSAILSVNAFPLNVEMHTLKTYSLGAAKPVPGESGGDKPGTEVASQNVGVTLEMSTSVMLMPEKLMPMRYRDPRVGYYSENYTVFSDKQQKVETKEFILRYNLQPRPEEVKQYKQGKLVEPQNPIVYYVDPATPKQWRPYIIAGINDWSKAFEAAGFKNAIVGKEWPAGDTTVNMEDARYKVVRYFPSGATESMIGIVHDPRTGEILQSMIGWSHNEMQMLHDFYMVQASAADPNARSMTFSDALMGALIQSSISRLIGRTLGLRANLGASAAVPTEKLRDKKWVEANGFNNSIMDMNLYNYVAQPDDRINAKGLIPQIGAYDKWAVKWGYTYTGAADFDADKKIASRWVVDSLRANPKLVFLPGTIGTTPSDLVDPRADVGDAGDDPVLSNEYALKNLRVVVNNLLNWTKESYDMYDNAARVYEIVVAQYSLIMKHACIMLGGTYETAKSVEQNGAVYAPVSRTDQKKAIAFLNKQIFTNPSWLMPNELLNKIHKPATRENIQRFQDNTLFLVLQPARLYRMTTEAMRFGKENVYGVDELLNDLRTGLFSELEQKQPIDYYRRFLQKSCIQYMMKASAETSKDPSLDYANSDVPVMLRAQLKKISNACKTAATGYTDPVQTAHLKYINEKINRFLSKDGEEKNAGPTQGTEQ